MCMCLFVSMGMWMQIALEARDVGSLGAEVSGSLSTPDMGAENQTNSAQRAGHAPHCCAFLQTQGAILIKNI